ncbi:hypothetical protein IWW37_006102 [Coemansia sp. RSA 2050]|nr:hypothetical protein IWW37_006102 [Coemansia sp. RSA 2050]KAJ2728020.1 hypothetical protein IW152_006088 [Coemansia sp. BCRC 34962]
MIIIGDLSSRLGVRSSDHGDNPRGTILEAHLRAADMEVINACLPGRNATFPNHNGSSVVDLVLAKQAVSAAITNFQAIQANDITEEQGRTCLRSDHNSIECSISVPHTEGIAAKPWFCVHLLDTDDDAHNRYHCLLGEGFIEWTEKAKQLLAQNLNDTTFEEATAALEMLNDKFRSIVLQALEGPVGRYFPSKPSGPPWWSHLLKELKNHAILKHYHARSIAEGKDSGSNFATTAHEDALAAQKDFNTAYQQAALAWWQRKQLLLTVGSVNTMMRSIGHSIRAKRIPASPSTIQHKNKRAIDAVREHFGMVLNHNACTISIVDDEYRRHLRKNQDNPFTAFVLKCVLRCCGSNKAPSPDELQVEALKASPVVVNALTQLLQLC